MKVNYIHILIERDKMTKVPKVVAPWEIPVYEAVYNDGEPDSGNGFAEVGEVEVELDEVPDAESEFVRMRNLHGFHEKQGVPFVDLAYGRGRAGLAELRRAINDALDIEEEESEPEPTAKRRLPKPAKKPARAAVESKSADDEGSDPLEQ